MDNANSDDWNSDYSNYLISEKITDYDSKTLEELFVPILTKEEFERKDCCVSEHPDSLRCGKPEVEGGSEKMRMLIQSEEVQKIISIITG